MSIPLNFFPVLNNDLTAKIGFQAIPYEFSYLDQGTEYLLEAISEGQHGALKITDERCVWSADEFNFKLKREIRISNPWFLFGGDGVACNSAEIGIAVLWTSKTSNQRGVVNIGSFKKCTIPVSFPMSISFGAGKLRGNLNLKTILYLKHSGNPSSSEVYFASQAGTVFGTVDECIAILDGSGSMFPIVEYENKSGPLWWVECNWVDPQTDSFDVDNVRICINPAHQSYGLLGISGGLKESPMLVDIIASAIQIIIQKVKEDECWGDVLAGRDNEHGSIGQAIHYFIDVHGWEVDSPERLAISIREYFDKAV